MTTTERRLTRRARHIADRWGHQRFRRHARMTTGVAFQVLVERHPEGYRLTDTADGPGAWLGTSEREARGALREIEHRCRREYEDVRR